MAGLGVSLIVVRAVDVARTVAFYESLGLTFGPEQHGSGPQHFSATVGEVVIEVYPARDRGSIERGGLGDVRLGFTVENLAAALGGVSTNGGTVEHGPTTRAGHIVAVVIDPDGRRVEITE